ncbi:hypothetical protein GYMLUDRAFT_246512 [Collybiopsis luxurians FD-317 M1]|uniref:Uncharacterized protein n=1 Tax=Collybiopsis luxurians FD-317 M1 TaxID=944289 RepID=A0A0D0BRL4_9AGAR|nr:hypothetical protein GYMLUDRAFT_246512 [Collybiopsis luxurians FD-317 M1]
MFDWFAVSFLNVNPTPPLLLTGLFPPLFTLRTQHFFLALHLFPLLSCSPSTLAGSSVPDVGVCKSNKRDVRLSLCVLIVNFDEFLSRFGAVYIGIVVAAVLFGVSAFQGWYYYTHYEDRWQLRFLVTVVLSLDVIHQALITHTGTDRSTHCWALTASFLNVSFSSQGYVYFVTYFQESATLPTVIWSILVEIFFNGLNALGVQGFLAYRIWKFSGTKIWLTCAVVLFIVAEFACVIALAIISLLHVKTFEQLATELKGLSVAVNVLAAFGDLLIAVYTNSLLATLNTRKAIRGAMEGTILSTIDANDRHDDEEDEYGNGNEEMIGMSCGNSEVENDCEHYVRGSGRGKTRVLEEGGGGRLKLISHHSKSNLTFENSTGVATISTQVGNATEYVSDSLTYFRSVRARVVDNPELKPECSTTNLELENLHLGMDTEHFVQGEEDITETNLGKVNDMVIS